MEVLYFQNPNKQPVDVSADGVTVIQEPIIKLTNSNRGHYRIHVHFILDPKKGKENLPELPRFGILSINHENIRHMPFDYILDCYDDVSISNPDFDKLIKRGIRMPGEFMVMDIKMINFCEMGFRIRIVTVDKVCSTWTPWAVSEIPKYARLMFDIPKEYIRIYDAQTYNLMHFGYGKSPSHLAPPSCCVCHELHCAFEVFLCGHCICQACAQEDTFRNEKFRCHTCNVVTRKNGIVHRRDAICPYDACDPDGEVYLEPCRCVIAHKEDPAKLIATLCPYSLCRKKITGVMTYYQSVQSGYD